MSVAVKLTTSRPETVADLLARLGDIPPERVLMQPAPGTATEDDLIRLVDAANKCLCELVDGVLVEKAMGFREGVLAGSLLHLFWKYLDKRDLGLVAGADSPIRLRLGLVRLPDVCFISWKRLGGPELPKDAVSKVIPELAVEILSEGNTRKEIELKRKEYFKAGVALVWVIDPRRETADIYTSATQKETIDKSGTLEGGKVLPGFKLVLKDLFARARRRQRKSK
ncbi:MAG: Uma2 family endonuclease [Gemmataceae bacterium]